MSFADRRDALTRSVCWLQTRPGRYGFALAAVAAAGLVGHGLDAAMGFAQPFIWFYPTIMAVVLLGGFGPGLFATLLSGAVAEYFLMQPLKSFSVQKPSDIVGLAL